MVRSHGHRGSCLRYGTAQIRRAGTARRPSTRHEAKAGGQCPPYALDALGNISIPFNTDGMYRGWIGADGVPHVALYGDEDDGTAEIPRPAPADSAE